MALRESVARADDEWEARVVVAFHHLQKIEKQDEPDLQQWEARNNDFHLALIHGCQSNWLRRIYQLLYDQHARYRVIARISPAGRDIHHEHAIMLDAALTKDIDSLLVAHEQHIRNTLYALENALDRD
jgi:DNA-binding GntR family transcriptional regulator